MNYLLLVVPVVSVSTDPVPVVSVSTDQLAKAKTQTKNKQYEQPKHLTTRNP